MIQKFRNLDQRQIIFGAVGFICGLFLPLVLYLTYLFTNIDQATQALVLATTLGALGTVALATATFFSVYQSTRSLELREKETTKPLVRDELANVIEPAINTLEANLNAIKNSEKEGCALEWLYVDHRNWYGGGRKPDPLHLSDSFAMGRILHEDPELFQRLKRHNEIVESISQRAEEFEEKLTPVIEQELTNYGLDADKNTKVATQAILQELYYFGEEHDLHDFWRDNRENLITSARDKAESEMVDIQDHERAYRGFLKNTIEQLRERKIKLKHDYNISEEEIRVDDSDVWDSI